MRSIRRRPSLPDARPPMPQQPPNAASIRIVQSENHRGHPWGTKSDRNLIITDPMKGSDARWTASVDVDALRATLPVLLIYSSNQMKVGELEGLRPASIAPRVWFGSTLYKSALWEPAGFVRSIGMALTRESAVFSVDALPAPTEPMRVRKVPTGIADLDSIVDGGFPSGSTILLLGDVGAGMQEYIYTAASKTALVHERPEARRYYLGDRCDDSELPERVCYVTFSRSKEIILQELATSFNGDYYRAFRDRTVFKDFSAAYFRHSVVPASWTHQEDPFDLPSTNLLEELIAFLDQNARDSVVVIDSLTDLAISDLVEPKDLVTTVKGLQRAAKGWDGLVYLLLTRGILERREEQLLMDSTDGCLVFEWRSSPRSSTRQRYMYLEKFTGVLPHLPRDKIARFPTMVSSYNGLVVVYMERIS